MDSQKRKHVKKPDEAREATGQVKRDPKRATDDFYFDKFRNKFRKH